jgi:hypothetical protein
MKNIILSRQILLVAILSFQNWIYSERTLYECKPLVIWRLKLRLLKQLLADLPGIKYTFPLFPEFLGWNDTSIALYLQHLMERNLVETQSIFGQHRHLVLGR